MPNHSRGGQSPPTFVVELTPVGRGAVAVVLVAGPAAINTVSDLFIPAGKRPITGQPVGRILYGSWRTTGEELVVCRRAEEDIEVHCHGGLAAVRAVIDSLQSRGCTPLSWHEWLSRGRVSTTVGLDSPQDATTCDAHIALAEAVTQRTAGILLDQLNGALSTAIHGAISALDAEDWPQATRQISELLEHRDVGLHLTTPWRVVLTGPPNVGKSSLINALGGYERAIVSPTPGTTRDVVTLSTAIDGWPVILADTAGLRHSDNELEAAGIELAQSALATADLAILVHDATDLSADKALWTSLPPRTITVCNKTDLVTANGGISNADTREQAIPVSALTGNGIAQLIAAIGSALVPNPPAPGAAVPFTPTHFDALARVLGAIEQRRASSAREALQSLLSGSFDASH